jgi:hypothetical protein
VRLANANEDVLRSALAVAWKLRREKNGRTRKNATGRGGQRAYRESIS